jgi:hypothetical protein
MAMSKGKRYWIWIDGKPGTPPHLLHDEIQKACLATGTNEFLLGRSTGTWSTALSYLRDYMKAGFVCRVYEVDE